MRKILPVQGTILREVRLEGSGKDRDVVIVPGAGERLRFPARGDVDIETAGRVFVRTAPIDETSLRVIFSAGELMLERAEVEFDGNEIDWDNMWRRARTRSRPWWREDGDELDLDWAMVASLLLVARA